MKLVRLVFLLASLAAASLSAQEFAGTLTWSVRVEVTDPELKKQMAQLADPAVHAQIKQAQEAMNTPEMQEMLKANPQMKEMMEKQMAALPKAGGDAAGGLFPKSFTLQIKGPRSLVKTEGGMSVGDVLTLADKNVSYQINRQARTYRQLPADPVKAEMGNYTVTPTTESASVLGYACKRYLVESNESGTRTTYSVWATNEIKGLDAASLRRMKFGASEGSAFLNQIEGIPLRIDVVTPQAKLFMVATGVKKEALADTLFTLPAGFKQTTAETP